LFRCDFSTDESALHISGKKEEKLSKPRAWKNLTAHISKPRYQKREKRRILTNSPLAKSSFIIVAVNCDGAPPDLELPH
jgi:hypothetical protein